MTRLRFPPRRGPDGRLLCVEGDGAAVRQLLGCVVHDLRRGEFPGAGHVHDPCDDLRGRSETELIADLARRLGPFLAKFGLTEASATAEPPAPGEEGVAGWVRVRIAAAARPLRLPVRRTATGLMLDVSAPEQRDKKESTDE